MFLLLPHFILRQRWLLVFLAFLSVPTFAAMPAVATVSLDELRPGQRGQVWTVFRGTEP